MGATTKWLTPWVYTSAPQSTLHNPLREPHCWQAVELGGTASLCRHVLCNAWRAMKFYGGQFYFYCNCYVKISSTQNFDVQNLLLYLLQAGKCQNTTRLRVLLCTSKKNSIEWYVRESHAFIWLIIFFCVQFVCVSVWSDWVLRSHKKRLKWDNRATGSYCEWLSCRINTCHFKRL